MSENIDLSLILPAFNERASIASTIDKAFACFGARNVRAEIIVAADGNDGTREVVRKMAAVNPALRVIGHAERSGKGRGIREAVPLARGRIIGYADADNKVPFEEYDKIRPWLDEGYEVVTGSRALEQSRIERRQPWFRRVGSTGFYFFMQTVVGLPGIRDTQCGFKYFPREVALRLFELQRIDGYMFDVEILALAIRLGYRVKEVPIVWRDDADSRLELFSGNFRNAIDIFRIRSFCNQQTLAPLPSPPQRAKTDAHRLLAKDPPCGHL
jgi:dolichyl-phosphate beta-glucosyltransferase